MSDPVSDFLAREQDALAGLDDEFAQPVEAPHENNVMENGFGEAVPQQNGLAGNDSGVDLSALDLNDANAISSLPNGRGASPISINSGRGSVPVEREEPEKIKKWRENQKQLIAEKDKAEEKKKEELREQAKKELHEWHVQRKARLEQRKKENLERQQHHFESNGKNDDVNSWERIGKLIESKSNRGTKDVSRMKALYAAYAEEPPTATV